MDVCRKNILGKGACLACLGKSEGLQGRECLEGTNRGGRYLGDEGGEEPAHICGSWGAIAWMLLVTLS